MMAPTPAAPPLDLAAVLPKRARSASILLVEDDNAVAALVTEMLQELDYRITRAASAQAALGALADVRDIDLVFTDVMMPGDMDGLGLAEEVTQRWPHLPVVITTGYASGALLIGGRRDIHVLHKPYSIQALDVTLRAALDASKITA
jgi:CheY-like chemotaxis protein